MCILSLHYCVLNFFLTLLNLFIFLIFPLIVLSCDDTLVHLIDIFKFIVRIYIQAKQGPFDQQHCIFFFLYLLAMSTMLRNLFIYICLVLSVTSFKMVCKKVKIKTDLMVYLLTIKSPFKKASKFQINDVTNAQ